MDVHPLLWQPRRLWPRGTYQFVIQRAQPKGQGALQLAFQQLHAKLTREGLFDPRRKKHFLIFPGELAL